MRGSRTVRKRPALMWSARSGCLGTSCRPGSHRPLSSTNGLKCPFLEKLVHVTCTYLRVSQRAANQYGMYPRTRPVHEHAPPLSASTPPPHSRITRDHEASLKCLITPLIERASTRSRAVRTKVPKRQSLEKRTNIG